MECYICRSVGYFAYVFIGVFVTIQQCHAKTYIVEESGLPNMLIGNVAMDFNFSSLISQGKSLRFSFINQNLPEVAYFNISEDSGELRSVGVLDREEICQQEDKCNIQLQIAVTATKESFFEKVKVNVTIDDINDHSPIFKSQTESISFPENSQIGTSFTIEGAFDPDSSKYSVKHYSIIPLDAPFAAHLVRKFDGSSSVQIDVDGDLDREVTDHYILQIIAEDGGSPPKTGSLQLNITITDMNDNFPIFTNMIYNKSVEEDIEINSTILQVSANDLDTGDNGKITYSFATIQQQPDIEDLFSIDSESGEIKTIGRLVYMPGHQYQLIVEAQDAGVNPKEAQALVYIDVQDVNNNAPKIDANLLSQSDFARVSELANIDAVAALIFVTDDDVGFNGITNCSMDSDTFGLQKSDINEYKVVVKEPLDREVQDLYTLTVVCEDVGTPPLVSSKTFNISIIDENDHKPEFSQTNYVGEIFENNNYGDVILEVIATDGDAGNNAKISFELRGDSWTDFAIHQVDDSGVGVIQAMKTFDREDKEYYEFLVLAIDGGKDKTVGIEDRHTSTATVTVKIVDKNDNNPKFQLAYYEFHVAENSPPEENIDQIVAEDADAGNNGIVTYSILDQPEVVLPFKLDPDGFLKAKKILDRELQSRYDFIVMATDQGYPFRLNSSVNVSVFVSDMNDNGPFIVSPEKPGRVVYVPVSTSVNTPLYLIQAHDIDAGRNQQLTYKIEDRNDTHIFDINDSGQVLVARPIESWEINTYSIQVAVYDNGNPKNFAKTTLIMSIMAANITAEVSAGNPSLESKNLLIALTVVIVTVVLAATIVISIIIIRRMDIRKRNNYLGNDTNSEHSLDGTVVPGLELDGQKDMYSGISPACGNLQLAPIVSQLSLDRNSMTKDYVYKPRMNTPTPSDSGNHGDIPLDVHADIQDTSTPRLNRLASLRLHQQLIQSHDKPWHPHNDSDQSCEMYAGRPEDVHSQLSEEDGDSGRGGSVSDGHMGISQDAEDMRRMQLQNLVKQIGRRGTPPHLQSRNDNQSKPSNLTPRDNVNQSSSNLHADQSKDTNKHFNLKSKYSNSNSDIFCVPEHEQVPNVRRFPSCQENNAPHTQKTVTFSNHFPKAKSGPGIQMGLSSISNHPHNSSRHKPNRQHSFDTHDNYRQPRNHPSNDPYGIPNNGRHLDETFESVTTAAYDDDDNTTTSGSYTIDNNAHEDFIELNVAQLKDIFV
ncbi:PC11Y-like protein [Mya arenaria]|uniref:PC11Y-like protein n=1 Tax=Mya arenaria TaxID=6604 RepID=A0ABY7DMX2_MYAAR|nr:protocadherin-11 X-linked-like [Mya arenaria]XP_052793040.1 protocadherin-11 X-linked-like [Mya arenaria]XP_052793041.1 protocadherin-11 X-linked-like [Mya arenaria]WAQ98694.1 PC11Y-like protein [Mya arenaria]